MRRSGIELLRILSLFAVIMIHYWEKAANYVMGINLHSLLFLRSLSASAVDIFILISGYFLCTTDKRTFGKPLNLIIQVSLINEMAYLAKSFCGLEPSISLRHIVSSLLPDSYYTTLFVVLYLISPYINMTISSLSAKGWKRLMVLLVSIFAIYQTGFDLFSEAIGKEMMGLSSIGAWGGQRGFTIVNFTLLYLVGAYLRNNHINISRGGALLGLMSCVVLLFVWVEVEHRVFANPTHTAWLYHNPIVILFAVMCFLYFKDLDISSKGINMAAKSVYTCFLAHCTIIANIHIEKYATMSVGYMLLHYLLFSVVIYVVCWILWWLYDKLTGSIYKKLDGVEFRYVN